MAYNEFYNYFWSYSYRRTFEATDSAAGTAPMKEELIKGDIEKLKKLCDVVVVSLHWGIENSNRITKAQQQLGYKIIDWGGDIVLGHHPHVLQGIEFYKEKLIVYSLKISFSTRTATTTTEHNSGYRAGGWPNNRSSGLSTKYTTNTSPGYPMIREENNARQDQAEWSLGDIGPERGT